MAARTAAGSDEFTDVNTDGEWEDVETEAQIIFDTIGDEFIGTFDGWSETEGERRIPQAHFINAEGKFFVNATWSLKEQLRKVKKGTLTRIRYVADQPIDGRDVPMKIFKVATKK